MISIFLSAVLLVVSSAPLVSAVACDVPPAHAAAMQIETSHAASDHELMMHGEHAPALALSADTCRIECGCGCHRSIDSLPNLLAPHSADAGFQPEDTSVERVAPAACIKLSALILSVTSPPPDSV